MSIAISFSHSDRGFSMNRRSMVQPAQLTRTSIVPNSESVKATAAWADSH